MTFYLLAVVAFSRELVWGVVYTIEVASGVFWIFNFLHLSLGLLEAWSVYPGIHLSGTAVCGSVFTLLARFIILVYQSLYLIWTFGPEDGIYLGIEANPEFWWWQYIWLSILCMIPWFFDACLQFYPALQTKIYTSRSNFVQSFFNILFPSAVYTSGRKLLNLAVTPLFTLSSG